MNAEPFDESLVRIADDLKVACLATLAWVGSQVGLFRALAGAGPLTIAELATVGGFRESFVREWTEAMHAAGYIWKAPSGAFALTPEQRMAFLGDEPPGSAAVAFFRCTPAAYGVAALESFFRSRPQGSRTGHRSRSRAA